MVEPKYIWHHQTKKGDGLGNATSLVGVVALAMMLLSFGLGTYVGRQSNRTEKAEQGVTTPILSKVSLGEEYASGELVFVGAGMQDDGTKVEVKLAFKRK